MDELEALKKENQSLKELATKRSDWVSISAHQLRTSLAANKWILKMFLDKDFGEITNEQAGFMKKAFDDTENMLGMVGEMLAANHTTDGTITYKFESADIVKIIEDVIFDFHGESFKKNVEIIFLKPNPLPSLLKLDVGKMRVVIQNLIENALKYSIKGQTVIVSVTDTLENVQISVKDQGIGIPKDEQAKIFEKFYRATNAKEKEAGSGLGLYMNKTIVEAHGGRMWFESQVGFGTTFFVTLPH
jgi:signal transduction histidine kinase